MHLLEVQLVRQIADGMTTSVALLSARLLMFLVLLLGDLAGLGLRRSKAPGPSS